MNEYGKSKKILPVGTEDFSYLRTKDYYYIDKTYLIKDLIRGMFHAALKTNPALEFAVLTGCLRVSKESIFTGMNNLRVDSITDPQFNSCFGFTDEEVKNLLDYYGIDNLYDSVKSWYDGYNCYGIAFWKKLCQVKLQ